jgi:hypothetical protein
MATSRLVCALAMLGGTSLCTHAQTPASNGYQILPINTYRSAPAGGKLDHNAFALILSTDGKDARTCTVHAVTDSSGVKLLSWGTLRTKCYRLSLSLKSGPLTFARASALQHAPGQDTSSFWAVSDLGEVTFCLAVSGPPNYACTTLPNTP